MADRYDPTPLVEAAKKATQGEWPKKVINWPRRSYLALGSCEAAGPAHMHASCGDDELAHAQAEKDADYIVAAQPRNILALVDSFQRDAEAKDARIRELEVAVEDANLRAAEASSAKDQALHKLDDALMANATTRERIVTRVMQDVAELPDRTSPDGCPDMMLVTEEELEEIIRAALGGLPRLFAMARASLAQPSAAGVVVPREPTDDPHHLKGTCEDPRLVAAGYKVCGSDCDRVWHWHGPDGRWHGAYRSEEAAVEVALRHLNASPGAAASEEDG